MRVLVTGGTGFIGSRLVQRFLERGDEVRVLAQANNPAEQGNQQLLEQAGAHFFLGSVLDSEPVGQAVKDVELIIHLAAAQHEANVADQHFYDVNVEGTRRLLDAAQQAGVKRFIHGSTIGVYGEIKVGVANEASPLNPVNIYGKTKREGEQLALQYADQMAVTVVRIPETYGPGDRRLLKLFKAIDKGVFFNIGGGNNKHHLMYVEDLIDGFLQAAEHPAAAGEVFLLAGRDVLSTNEMIASIAQALGRPAPRIRVPLWMLMLLAVVLETTMKPLGKQPPLHRRRMDFFVKSFVLSGEKAARLLDYRPRTSFSEGAVATAAWYREQGLLQ